MQEESENKQSLPVIEIVLIFLVIAIIVIAILTLLGPAAGTTHQNIVINL